MIVLERNSLESSLESVKLVAKGFANVFRSSRFCLPLDVKQHPP